MRRGPQLYTAQWRSAISKSFLNDYINVIIDRRQYTIGTLYCAILLFCRTRPSRRPADDTGVGIVDSFFLFFLFFSRFFVVSVAHSDASVLYSLIDACLLRHCLNHKL